MLPWSDRRLVSLVEHLQEELVIVLTVKMIVLAIKSAVFIQRSDDLSGKQLSRQLDKVVILHSMEKLEHSFSNLNIFFQVVPASLFC